jgi:hypothetical protein
VTWLIVAAFVLFAAGCAGLVVVVEVMDMEGDWDREQELPGLGEGQARPVRAGGRGWQASGRQPGAAVGTVEAGEADAERDHEQPAVRAGAEAERQHDGGSGPERRHEARR